jgi:hypothetical protein
MKQNNPFPFIPDDIECRFYRAARVTIVNATAIFGFHKFSCSTVSFWLLYIKFVRTYNIYEPLYNVSLLYVDERDNNESTGDYAVW